MAGLGNYLNVLNAYDEYLREAGSPYYVDKSLLLDELIPRIETSTNCICII